MATSRSVLRGVYLVAAVFEIMSKDKFEEYLARTFPDDDKEIYEWCHT